MFVARLNENHTKESKVAFRIRNLQREQENENRHTPEDVQFVP
jgi:hypothetical protein